MHGPELVLLHICSIYNSVFNACIVARVELIYVYRVLQCALFSTPTCEKLEWNSQQSVLHILEVEVVLSLIANTSATFACSTMQCSVMEATPGIGEGMARSH